MSVQKWWIFNLKCWTISRNLALIAWQNARDSKKNSRHSTRVVELASARQVRFWCKTAKIFKNYSMQYSHVVSHHSTDCTSTSLTSGIRRDPVLSGMYGRSCKQSTWPKHKRASAKSTFRARLRSKVCFAFNQSRALFFEMASLFSSEKGPAQPQKMGSAGSYLGEGLTEAEISLEVWTKNLVDRDHYGADSLWIHTLRVSVRNYRDPVVSQSIKVDFFNSSPPFGFMYR